MPVKSDSLLVGLSMGTTKTTMIVAERDRDYPDSVHVIGFGDAPSRGISRGVIVNIQEAQQSVTKALQDAQGMTGISSRKLSNVVVAFNAMDIKSESSHGFITLPGMSSARESKSVERKDLDRLIGRAREDLNVNLRNNLYSLHMIPTSYELDGRPVDEPLNMNGNRLDMWLQTVAVPINHVQNVRDCVRKAGLEVKGLILKPLASSLGAVYEEEMRSGCISICIGGGTTGIVLYRGGRAFRVISIPIGGDHIKSDLATVLHMHPGQAEQLKKIIFTSNPEELRSEGIDVDLAVQVILARVEELFGDYVRAALAECTPQHFPSGIILSGGVSKTPGIENILADILQMPVRKVSEPIYPLSYGLDNPAYVSAAGILKYCLIKESDPYVFMDAEQFNNRTRNRDNRDDNNNNDEFDGVETEEIDEPERNDRPEREEPRPIKREREKTRQRDYNDEPDYYDSGNDEDGYDNEDYDDDDRPKENNLREAIGNFMTRLRGLF
ncbi:MAG: cell division protein FtsA [Synergistaceae bacterium]|nr:cell division protein FtsA [Synergistaceae bacterium]